MWLHNNTLTQYVKKVNAKNKKLKKKLKRKAKAYKKIKRNRDGLINQHNLDQKDKRILHNRVLRDQLFIRLLINYLPKNKIPELSKKIKLIKEMSNFDQNNEGSQNNQH